MKKHQTPRQYQTNSYNDIKKSFARGNKHICLVSCGGSGKSLLCKMIIDSALAKGSKVGFFSFRKSLTEQIKTYFDNVDNIDIGTLQKFGKSETKMYDLIILDEKDFTSTKLRQNIKSKYSIVMSGCPTDTMGNVLEFDDIVEGIQYIDLYKQNFAKEIKVLSISKIDTSKLKKVAGDFRKKDSFDIMEKPTIKKDIIESYKKYCIGRKSLLFAIDINHAESLKKEFLENGIKCDTVHSKKKSDNIIEDFENDKFDLLINVAQISIGVDIPCINTIIFARPMVSMPLMLQCVWRGTRKFKDDYCLVLDLAEVIKRVNFHPIQRIDLTKKKQDKKVKEHCNQPMIILSKTNKMIDELTYMQTTIYKCNVCSQYEDKEEMKVVNMQFCDGCSEQLTDTNIEMVETKKALEFVITCDKCGFKNSQRSILLSDKELKIVEHIENLNSKDDWIKIEAIIKDEVKKAGYKWQYKDRIMEHLANKRFSSEYVLERIELIKSSGNKISKLMFI